MRLFETLDILNQQDDEKKTATAGCCFEMVACDMKGKNGYVKMGVPPDVALNIINDNRRYRPVLVIIDMDAYNAVNKES
jgi:hypothetical protein